MAEVVIAPTFEGWRSVARRLITAGVPPSEVAWLEERPGRSGEAAADASAAAATLFDPAPVDIEAPPAVSEIAAVSGAGAGAELRVPRAFVALAEAAARTSDPDRWALLYSVLWRVARGDRNLLLTRDDPDLQRLRRLADTAPPAPAPGAESFLPPSEGRDLESLRSAAASCHGCDLWREATQTVFGRGPASSRAVLVGEQPGDFEDRQGAPFVGPAGEVLDRALSEAGLPRERIYVTNAVKHFKFVRTPKRRIHQTPGPIEIAACRPWLDAELAVLRPQVLVLLGATASKALLGPAFRLMQERGRFLPSTLAPRVLATMHPSAILRAEDAAGKERLYGYLRADLALAAAELEVAGAV